ncbi:TetR/AcrR family transcriptional regulator [Acinetobacter larvae]|uniref:TetR family transcriptional regulator n=1 Tax=Acinetobacter larvae TaxID=1789224 RepID=A0A1B2LXG6_9GAMM|nr:TetR/AcrR family transcriptional regulator [Acinetobacter larvae]AOA57644.1 TetR family transcriptional regulator [Acinetobacter larvae]
MQKSTEKILSTAEQLFNQHSFSSVGVDLIRDQSGCSKTTLYKHFKNKHYLIQTVLKQRHQRWQAAILASIAGQHGLAALKALYDWHISWFQQADFKGCLFVRAVAESMPQDREITAIAQAHKQWIQQQIILYCQQLGADLNVAQCYYLLLEGMINEALMNGISPQVATQQWQMLEYLLQAKSTS